MATGLFLPIERKFTRGLSDHEFLIAREDQQPVMGAPQDAAAAAKSSKIPLIVVCGLPLISLCGVCVCVVHVCVCVREREREREQRDERE